MDSEDLIDFASPTHSRVHNNNAVFVVPSTPGSNPFDDAIECVETPLKISTLATDFQNDFGNRDNMDLVNFLSGDIGRESLGILTMSKIDDLLLETRRPSIGFLKTLEMPQIVLTNSPSISNGLNTAFLASTISDERSLNTGFIETLSYRLSSGSISPIFSISSNEDSCFQYTQFIRDLKASISSISPLIGSKNVTTNPKEDDKKKNDEMAEDSVFVKSKVEDCSIFDESLAVEYLEDTKEPHQFQDLPDDSYQEDEEKAQKCDKEAIFKSIDQLIPKQAEIVVPETEVKSSEINNQDPSPTGELNEAKSPENTNQGSSSINKINEEVLTENAMEAPSPINKIDEVKSHENAIQESCLANKIDEEKSPENSNQEASITNRSTPRSRSRNPKEILQDLEEALKNKPKSVSENLLSSLANILLDNNDKSPRSEDSGHSSIFEEQQKVDDFCDVLDSSAKSLSKLEDNGPKSVDLSQKKSLLPGRRHTQSFIFSSPKLPMRLNKIGPSKSLENTRTSKCSSADSSKNSSGFNLKTKKAPEIAKRGPMKATASLSEVSKIKVTPKRPDSGIPSLKRNSTPVRDYQMRPMAQSTPDGIPRRVIPSSPISRQSPSGYNKRLSYSNSRENSSLDKSSNKSDSQRKSPFSASFDGSKSNNNTRPRAYSAGSSHLKTTTAAANKTKDIRSGLKKPIKINNKENAGCLY